MATSAAALSLGHPLSARSLRPVHWRGYALGTEGQFTLYTDDPAKAKQTLERCFQEIRRLEAIFSLYDHQSELSQLNRTGQLEAPAPEWHPLLRAIDQAYAQTDGLFDPTIQPLWTAYQTHFQANPGARTGPTTDQALDQVGWAKVSHSHNAIRLGQPGMALTLNGIAQGYITDRISDLLRAAGYGQVLIELGETRALGQHPEGRPWQIGIQQAGQRETLFDVASLSDQALATSGSYGTPFSQDGRFHHLIHPRTGQPSAQWTSLSVIAPTATQADALSTGLSFADSAQIDALMRQFPEIRVISQSS